MPKTDAKDAVVTTKAEGPDGKSYTILSTEARPNGLVIDELRIGTGAQAKPGSTITIHYHGTLASGKVFDTTRDGEPAEFPLNRLIEAWKQGIPGMKIGGVRRLTVPPVLGYGKGGTPDGTIPPNATLVFSIEMVAVE